MLRRMSKRPSTVETLAANLDYLMRANGYSEAEVSKRSGVASKTVNNMRRGRTKASIENADKVARVFGLSGWQLIIPDYPLELLQDSGLASVVDNYAHSNAESRNAIKRIAEREAHYSASKAAADSD